MSDCIKRIVERSNGVVDAKAAKELLKEIDDAARRKMSDGFDRNDAIKQIVAERLENTTKNIAKEKANIARNIVKKAASINRISAMIDSGMSVKDALRAEFEGTNSPIQGAKDSLDVAKKGVENAYLARFIRDMNRANLLEVYNSKALDDEIGKELWAMSKNETITKSKEAKQIAEIIYNTRNGMRERMNAAGADIEQTEGFIMHQSHDITEMFKMGEEAWVDFMLPLLDERRSFGGDYGDLYDVLRGAYRAMVSGIRLDTPLQYKNIKNQQFADSLKAGLFQVSSPSNLAKKMSQSRQIHFKNYESWKKWNDTLGSRDLNEGTLSTIGRDAENIALMERYGTNPEAMGEAFTSEITKKYRDKVAAEGELGVQALAENLINMAMGKNDIPANPKTANRASNIRVFQNVTKLGGILLAQVGDMPLKSLEYQFQGKSFLSAQAQPWIDLLHGFKSKKDKIEASSLSAVGLESMVGDIGGRFSAQDTLSNKASKIQRMYFKLNGSQWWTGAHQRAMGNVMGHHLGLKKDLPFDALDVDTKRLFGNYRITEKDWDVIRASAKQMDDGRTYIFQDSIDDQKIREKLAGYFVDRVDSGVIFPGARERRISTFDTQRGTPIGETVRLMMQFKSFPITAVTKVWGRALYGKGKADIPAMAQLMLTTMAFGYLIGAMKDLAKGRSPKDPRKLETAFASMAQGGGLGILGDVLLQDGTGFGRSLSQTLAGPTFGTLDEAFKIYSAGIRGGGSANQALKFGVNSIPGNNLFYVRPALDQILLLQIQESLNPGYIRRMEQNMKKTYGQELLFQ